MFSSVFITEDGWHSSHPPHVGDADVWPLALHLPPDMFAAASVSNKNPEVLRRLEIKLSMSVTFSHRTSAPWNETTERTRGELISVFLCNENFFFLCVSLVFFLLLLGPSLPASLNLKAQRPGRPLGFRLAGLGSCRSFVCRCAWSRIRFPSLTLPLSLALQSSPVLSALLQSHVGRRENKNSHAKSGKIHHEKLFYYECHKRKGLIMLCRSV